MKSMVFTPELAQAVKEGRKTQTRRLVEPQPSDGEFLCLRHGEDSSCGYIHPKHQPGDRLEVWEEVSREPCPCMERPPNPLEGAPGMTFVDVTPFCGDCENGWIIERRFTGHIIEITAVRCEQVQEISHLDSVSEGMMEPGMKLPHRYGYRTQPDTNPPRYQFQKLFESIYPGSWERNDWVFAYTFDVVGKSGSNE